MSDGLYVVDTPAVPQSPRALVSGEFAGLELLDPGVVSVVPGFFERAREGWHYLAAGCLTPDAIDRALVAEDIILRYSGVEFLRGGVARVSCREQAGSDSECSPVAAARLALARCWAACGAWRVHAAAVEYGGHGFVLTGASGLGKSTAAMSALAAGARVVSDDEVLVWIDRGRPVATRVRPWLMARSATHESLAAARPELRLAWHGTEGEHRALIPEDPQNFPESIILDCWAPLQAVAAGERPSQSLIEAPESNPLAGLMVASAPLFLTAAFEPERKALLESAAAFARGVCRVGLITGRDLIDEPVAAWERLCARIFDPRGLPGSSVAPRAGG